MLTLGQGATFFVAHGATSGDILLLALVVYLLPAVLVTLLAVALGIFSTAIAAIFVQIAIGALVGLWLMGLVSAQAPTHVALLALSGAVAAAYSYRAYPRFRELAQVVGLLSPVAILLFTVFSPVKGLIFPQPDFGGERVSGKETPIVLIVLDELSLAAITTPGDNIDAQRLPNFARVAQMSTWYDNATTISTHTEKSVPAILSGMRVVETSQPIYSEFPRNLFTLFSATHTIDALEAYTRLCPERVCGDEGASGNKVLDHGAMYRDVYVVLLHSVLPSTLAQQYLPPIASRWNNFTADSDSAAKIGQGARRQHFMVDVLNDATRTFNRFISLLQERTGPSLTYLHLVLPHTPWIYLPDGTTYNGQFAPGRSLEAKYGWMDDQYLVDQAVLRYSLQVEYSDRLIGQALDVLEQSGRLNEMLLILVSDHGIAFEPGEEQRIPVSSTLADMSRVPLFIKYPGQTSGSRDSRHVETIDIFPTIAEVLVLPLGEGVDGQSLIADDWEPRQRSLLEAAVQSPAMNAEMNMEVSRERIYRVIKPGVSALESIGHGVASPFIGKPVPDLTYPSTHLNFHLKNASWYREVDLASGFLPARMTGKIDGDSAGLHLLVALNGIVAGGGMVHDDAGAVSIMLDPRLFHEGRNDLRVYAVLGADVQEIPVILDSESWTIERNVEGEAKVHDRDGMTYTSAEGLRGIAMLAPGPRGSLVVAGNACEESKKTGAIALLLVSGNEIVLSDFVVPDRAFYDKVRVKCKFSAEVDKKLVEKNPNLSVIALFDEGRMLELPVRTFGVAR